MKLIIGVILTVCAMRKEGANEEGRTSTITWSSLLNVFLVMAGDRMMEFLGAGGMGFTGVLSGTRYEHHQNRRC